MSDCVEEVGRERDPASAPAFFDGAADAPAGVWFVEVAALEAFLLELADAHASCVEDEHGQRVEPRHEAEDGLDLVGGGGVGSWRSSRGSRTWVRSRAGLSLTPAKSRTWARTVRLLRMVSRFRPDCMEGGDELGDVGRSDLVDAVGAEEWEDAGELNAVADRCPIGDVDA